ncbi:MAG: hypothetical protein CM15mP116_03950 [Synechococcus sp.]|nr:MAG: hypothetical protein CM15mP116_03950 [Synechococcus sp.]
MTFYTCLDNKGDVIARCQTKKMLLCFNAWDARSLK